MSKPMTATDVRSLLAEKCAAAGGQAPWAREHKMAPQNLNDIARGRRSLSPTVLRALGLRKEIVYYGVEDATE